MLCSCLLHAEAEVRFVQTSQDFFKNELSKTTYADKFKQLSEIDQFKTFI
jgi:hypothetical protein